MNQERLAQSKKRLATQRDALASLLKDWPEKMGPASRMRSRLERAYDLILDCMEWIGEHEKEFDA